MSLKFIVFGSRWWRGWRQRRSAHVCLGIVLSAAPEWPPGDGGRGSEPFIRLSWLTVRFICFQCFYFPRGQCRVGYCGQFFRVNLCTSVGFQDIGSSVSISIVPLKNPSYPPANAPFSTGKCASQKIPFRAESYSYICRICT